MNNAKSEGYITIRGEIHKRTDLTATEKMLFGYLERQLIWRKKYNEEWFGAATKTIGKQLGLCRQTVGSAVQKLVALDLLDIKPNPKCRKPNFKTVNKKWRPSHLYRVNVENAISQYAVIKRSEIQDFKEIQDSEEIQDFNEDETLAVKELDSTNSHL